MFAKTILMYVSCLLCITTVEAQAVFTDDEVNEKSLDMYNAGQWKELLQYGKQAIDAGIDFPYLRMRVGYSAFMIGNYSQSLLHYDKVLQKDPENEIAVYYLYLNNLYLNNLAGARYYAAKLPAETKDNEKISEFRLNAVELESSIKLPQDSARGTAVYARAGLNFLLGYRTQFHISGAHYQQKISEPKFIFVNNNRNISINQNEGYGRLIFSATGKLSVIAAYHYLYTPFNNFIYNNHIGYLALKYNTPYINFLGAANLGKIGDSTFNQFDATVTTYPLGNLKIYTTSRVSYGKDFTYSQVAGVMVAKRTWVEANIVLGNYRTLLENHALYVYNDIDTKKLKAGVTLYYTLDKFINANMLNVAVNYNFEQKQKIFTTEIFNQHSITGGIIWNF